MKLFSKCIKKLFANDKLSVMKYNSECGPRKLGFLNLHSLLHYCIFPIYFFHSTSKFLSKRISKPKKKTKNVAHGLQLGEFQESLESV